VLHLSEFSLPLSETALRQQSSLALAYIGDCVYELLVRTEQLLRPPAKVSLLHRRTTSQVKAAAQAEVARRLFPLLFDEEKAVFLRGRNTKTHQTPKGATSAEYAQATALEALFGWLYLAGRQERLQELYQACRPASEEDENPSV
jgi:ribonuclease-3 family protein